MAVRVERAAVGGEAARVTDLHQISHGGGAAAALGRIEHRDAQHLLGLAGAARRDRRCHAGARAERRAGLELRIEGERIAERDAHRRRALLPQLGEPRPDLRRALALDVDAVDRHHHAVDGHATDAGRLAASQHIAHEHAAGSLRGHGR